MSGKKRPPGQQAGLEPGPAIPPGGCARFAQEICPRFARTRTGAGIIAALWLLYHTRREYGSLSCLLFSCFFFPETSKVTATSRCSYSERMPCCTYFDKMPFVGPLRWALISLDQLVYPLPRRRATVKALAPPALLAALTGSPLRGIIPTADLSSCFFLPFPF